MASPVRTKWLLALLALFCAGFPRAATSDLYVHFLLDRSGSMWAKLTGKPKILHVSHAVLQVLQDLPPDAVVGLRVYPPPYTSAGAEDPGLRIPLEPGNREPFPYELNHLNPAGRGSLAANIEKALKDFPPGDHFRILLLLCDSSDSDSGSFCGRIPPLDMPEEVGVHILALDVQDATEQEELKCLAEHLAGAVTHITAEVTLSESLLAITRKALQEEIARQERIGAERQKRMELAEKTRIRLEFHNTLDPFFADAIEIVQCRLGDQDASFDTPVRLAPGQGTVLLDVSVPAGDNRVLLQYKKWKNQESATSKEAASVFTAREGKITHIRCFPKAGLFRWGCGFKEVMP